jgi:hypothetical protein
MPGGLRRALTLLAAFTVALALLACKREDDPRGSAPPKP